MHHDIFISYRIDDTLTQAGRLHQSLEAYFGAGTVFYDKSNLQPGMKWPKELEEKVRQAKVVLLLYKSGDKWLGVGQFGKRRIDNPDDWVFKEVAYALQSEKQLIPVLFGQDRLPPPDCMPELLQALDACQGQPLREEAWDSDLAPLLRVLEKYVKPRTNAPAPDPADPLEDFPLPDALPLPRLPYKGLTWFEASDARIFFGRETEIAELYKTRLCSPYTRTVLLYGQSGAGKSSLLHAGLTPRLIRQGWKPEYRRRTRDGSATDIARQYLDSLKTLPPEARPLLILDQLEEMFTHPLQGETMGEEQAVFPGLLLQLLDAHPELRILLGFREDYLAPVKEMLQDIRSLEFRLNIMDQPGLRRAVAAIPESPLKNEYKDLSFAPGEESLPARIAEDLYAPEDSRSNATPLLQFVLRKMWDELEPRGPQVTFSWALYQQHRRRSVTELLQTQLETLRDNHAYALYTGLALDLLREFVTPDSTAGQQALDALSVRYRHLPADGIPALCRALQGCYLLSDAVVGGQPGYRLAHDALAHAATKLFSESPAPGQRARLILESKFGKGAAAWTAQEIPFSPVDLDVLRQGKLGMYTLPDEWVAEVDKAERHYLAEREKDERQRQGIASFYLKEARDRLYSLQYEQAYHSVVEALRFDCLHPELAAVLTEIAFAEAEGPNHSLVRECLTRLGETVAAPLDVGHLTPLEGVAFANAVHALLETTDVALVCSLRVRYCPDMLEVPGGQFTMGNENEPHPAAVSSFAVARTPVTWEQFYLFCIATQRPLPESPSWGRAADNPLVNVGWYDAVEYANWLSERLGKSPVYEIDKEKQDQNNKAGYDDSKWTVSLRSGANGFRLLTETEWEYAARGGEQGAKDGFIYAGSNDIEEVAWYSKNSAVPDGIRRTRGVYDTKRPNQLGLVHMSGNVREWCWDWHGDYLANPEKDYNGPETGSNRVIRGGSWSYFAEICRSARRFRSYPGYRNNSIGFRLVFVP